MYMYTYTSISISVYIYTYIYVLYIYTYLHIYLCVPVGGSLVILTPFCRMSTGKWGEGYEVSQSRKLECTAAGSISSTSFSSVIIHET